MAIRAILRQPFYPWLLGIYPILHLYTENLSLVIDSEVMPSVLIMLAGTSIAFIFINKQLHNIHLTAVVTSLCSIAFSLSGHVYVEVFMPRSLGIWTILLLLALGVISIGLSKLLSRRNIDQATPGFNMVMLALLSIQLIRLAIGFVEWSKYVDVFVEFSALASERPNTPKVPDSATRPDIYYIIPDGYPSDAMLKKTANFDNSEFTAALEERGFVVVDHAQSNYPITIVSLASTLNMQYYSANPSPYSDRMYLKLETANSKVARFLLGSGYTYIQLLTNTLLQTPWADISKYFTSKDAVDIEIDIAAISAELRRDLDEPRTKATFGIDRTTRLSFFSAYFDTTLLRLARSRLIPLIQDENKVGYSDKEPKKFLDTIDEAIKVSEMPEATFTIIHLLKPHQPVVFSETGEIINEHLTWNPKPSPEEFVAELKYVNTRFLYLIDSILASSENPPVILFQADHSSVLGSIPRGHRFTMFDIYAAYYVPPPYSVSFPEPYTTVNAFPLILNEVFDSEFETQADRLFEMTKAYKEPFAQVEVTEECLSNSCLFDI